MDSITIHCIGSNPIWHVDHSLPKGISFSDNYGIISGTPEILISRTEFRVSATTDLGSFSTYFFLTVKECIYGKEIHIDHDINAVGHIILWYGFTRVVDDTSTGPWCIPYNSYHYSITCKNGIDFCSYNMRNSNGRSFLRVKALVGETVTGIVDLTSDSLEVSIIPSMMTTRMAYSQTISIDIQGTYDNVTFIPSLPPNCIVDSIQISYLCLFYGVGVFHYSVIITTPDKEVSVPYIIGIGVCPENLTPVKLYFINEDKTLTITVLNSHNRIIFLSDIHNENKWGYLCLREGEINIIRLSTTAISASNEQFVEIIQDDDVCAHFSLPKWQNSIDHYFSVNSYILRGSLLRYFHGKVEKDWTSRLYDDSTWYESSTKMWGSFDVNTIYFRRHFWVQNVVVVNNVMIDIEVQDGCIVYLNGEEVIRYNIPLGPVDASTVAHVISASATSLQRFFISMNYLQNGDNIISIEVHRSESTSIGSSIDFDLLVQGDYPRCSYLNRFIKASDNQHASGILHDPELAFGEEESMYWLSVRLPAVITATFKEDRSDLINWMTMHVDDGDQMPTEWRVEGVKEDNSTDVLYTMKGTTYMKYGTQISIKMNPRRSYHSYRFVFEKVTKGEVVKVSYIALYHCNNVICNKKWGNKDKTTDDVIYGKCPLFRDGINKQICSINGDKSYWVSSGCVPIHPPQALAYIDTFIRFINTPLGNWVIRKNGITLKSALIQIIQEELKVRLEEISFPSVRDMSTNDAYLFDVFMRFTVEYEIGDYIHKHELLLMNSLDSIMNAKYGHLYPKLSIIFHSKPVLRTCRGITSISVIVFYMIIGITTISICIYMRYKGQRIDTINTFDNRKKRKGELNRSRKRMFNNKVYEKLSDEDSKSN